MSSLSIIRVNPLDYAAQIKELFLAHDRPEFPEFFDRAYPSAVQAGAKSWIGVDGSERVVMHMALFPRRFALGERMLVGGLLVNLMAASSHRTFLPALSLIRKLTTDAQKDGEVDFLYGDPNAPARALLKTAGFSTVGSLRRFVLPLAGGTWYAEGAVRLYQTVIRLRSSRYGLGLVEHAAGHFNAHEVEQPLGQAEALRPFRPVDLYGERLPAYPLSTDYWFTLHHRGRSGPAAALLVRGNGQRMAQLLTIVRDAAVPLTAIVPPLAGALRRAGYARLSVTTLSETELARELSRAGFFLREDGVRAETVPIMARAFTESGAHALRSAATWELTDLDCDR